MAWNKIIFAAALALFAAPRVRAEAPTTAPADHEITDAERAKLEAASEATTAPAAVAAAATTQPAIPVVPVMPVMPSQPYRSYSSSGSSGGGTMVLPSSYYALMSRSIFIKGSQEVIDRFGNNRNSYTYNSHNDRSSNAFPTTQSVANRPEASLIFDGATHADGRFTALIEDTGSHAITPVSPGDRLARGTITALSLSRLDYTAGGRTVHVGVGQNLDGVDAALGGAAAGTSGQGGTPSPSSASPSSSSGSGTGDTTAAPAGANDVLEKLRKRRQQELSGK